MKQYLNSLNNQISYSMLKGMCGKRFSHIFAYFHLIAQQTLLGVRQQCHSYNFKRLLKLIILRIHPKLRIVKGGTP